MPGKLLEAEALLALIRDDEAEAKRLLREMLPGKLRRLAEAAGDLKWLVRDEILRQQVADRAG
jgi:hypothetical protein